MRKHAIVRAGMALGLAAALSACGSDHGCEAADYETHLDLQASTPDNVDIMLHHASRTCSAVGVNTYHAYAIVDDEATHAKLHPTQHDEHTEAGSTPMLDVVGVAAHMPAHGHGTTVDPTIDADDPAFFTVEYQMPGTWELSLQVSVPSVTDTVQTVTYTLDVVD